MNPSPPFGCCPPTQNRHSAAETPEGIITCHFLQCEDRGWAALESTLSSKLSSQFCAGYGAKWGRFSGVDRAGSTQYCKGIKRQESIGGNVRSKKAVSNPW